MKLKRLIKKLCKRIRLYESVVIGAMVVVIFIALLYGISTNFFEPKYKSENYPVDNAPQNESSVLGTKYNYYLDISPSMTGFFAAENNNMSTFANVLEDLNLSTHDNKFYTCSHYINNVSENVFYEGMRSDTYRNQYYQNINNITENNEENLETTLKNLDLSKIFTETYDDNASFNSEGTVNMIITDMNFILKESDLESHNMLLERFTNSLSDKVGELNFCIYNIDCRLQGTRNYDNNVENAGSEFINNSFFIIILAKDNNVYSSYINRLEKLFEENEIGYRNNKFELKNNLFEDQNQFKVDHQRFVNLDNTTLENFNFDNKSVEKMPDNAVGVRIIKGSSNTAAIKLQVASFELPGYVQELENKNQSTIDTIIKIYYPHLFGYREYTEETVLERNAAYLEWQDDVLWLIFEADFNINTEVPVFLFNKSFYIADVQFVMKKPAYTIPEWISSINTEEIPEDWNKKIHIKNFIATVIEKKNEKYESSATDYQRYMGNLLIYVNQ